MTADLMGNKSSDELAGIIERIEALESEKKQAGEMIKAEYDAAAGAGFDKKAIKALIKERRSDAVKTIELRAVINAYRAALARKIGNKLGELGELGEWARTWGATENKMGVHVAFDEYKGWKKGFDEMFDKGKPPRSGKDAASGEDASP